MSMLVYFLQSVLEDISFGVLLFFYNSKNSMRRFNIKGSFEMNQLAAAEPACIDLMAFLCFIFVFHTGRQPTSLR